ncbi:MAG: LysR family transcriptional regulator [Geminicoccaceae bacterium]|nr:LysR family transcriptional regulator [Geminicoccaceae bacterium]MDW8370025.1 LysR family transcriptional regulator [Geminicoccaceae bacterium]
MRAGASSEAAGAEAGMGGGPEPLRTLPETGAEGSEREARAQTLAITLHQLRLFWTLAHARSLTQAAKQLGISQPALSQALAKLERLLGQRLVDRQAAKLELTDAGRFLLERAGRLLAEADALESGLAAYKAGLRGRVSVGVLASIARTLLPPALELARRTVPELALDVHEVAPQEAIEGLYGRTLEAAVVSETAVASDHLPFTRIPLREDGYALAVPASLRLDDVLEPERELDAEAQTVLGRTIEFNFGTLHADRVAEWYRRVLPRARTLARVRTYETALAMVESGHGVALVPQLTAQLAGRMLFAVRLYAVPTMERRLVALVPGHRRRMEPLNTFLEALTVAARELRVVPVAPPPPFVVARAAG